MHLKQVTNKVVHLHIENTQKVVRWVKYNKVKADFQSVLRTLDSLFTTFVLFHVRRHKM